MARKVKTTPAAATTTTKVEDNKEKVKEVKEVKEVKPIEKSEVVQETPKTKKTTKGKRKFTIYYDGAMIPGVYIFGQRPKQAATKALNVILKRFFTKDKEFDVSAIGKEIKFYIEEVIKTDTTEKVNRFYYKGSKNYIVTEETMKKYESKKVKIEKDKDGIYGIVAEHKGANGSVTRLTKGNVTRWTNVNLSSLTNGNIPNMTDANLTKLFVHGCTRVIQNNRLR